MVLAKSFYGVRLGSGSVLEDGNHPFSIAGLRWAALSGRDGH
ncbi:MAG: hypothetical protein WHX93_16255 [bacterium]